MKYQNKIHPKARIKWDITEQSADKPWRFHFIRIMLFLSGVIIFLRLIQIQIIDKERYIQEALDQYTRSFVLKATRGLIYDRNMTALALNKPCFDIGLDKRYAEDYEGTSQKLARVLKQNKNSILKKIRNAKDFVLLTRKLEEDAASIIRLMNIPGIKIIELSERVYPLNDKLAQVIGFVDVDGQGISGIELAYDSYLSGKDGRSILLKDALGKYIRPVSSASREQTSGNHVILTVDNVIQTIAEEELNKAVSKSNAKGGCVIVTNPNTGEILAMTAAPGFNANEATKNKPESWRIRAITDIFEPGSTFKIVTMLAALSGKHNRLDDIIFCENGKYTLFGEEIHDSKEYGWLSFNKVFINSSNIGTAKIAQEIGKYNLYLASRNFGFGTRTGIELPGEVSGILKKPLNWSNFSLAAISYGHEVAVTPLQVAMAYSAIANGGKLMKPGIIKDIRSPDNKSLYQFKPQIIREVMDSETATTLAEILTDVVEIGTGQLAKIPDIKIAGKTGTAQKPRQDRPGYSDSQFVASFAGFYPSEQAQLSIYVTIDEPTPFHSGGSIAAPVFRNILNRILSMYKQPNERHSADMSNKSKNKKPGLIPDLEGRRKETALHILDELNIRPKIFGEGNIVQKLELTYPADKNEYPEIILTLADYPQKSGYIIMPELKDLSLRKAVSELSLRGLDVKIFGSGRVKKQDPKAGAQIKAGATCMLECEPVINMKNIERN